MFESLGKYPEVQRPEKLIHTHTTRHAVVFAPTEKTKEFYHLPDQLAKITYSTENDIKDLLEITKACFDREWFTTITSNPDVIQGVGDTPKCATSLSDFVMFGGSKNPYLSDLKEPAVKAPKIIPKEDKKTTVSIEQKISPSVIRTGTSNDTFQAQIRSSKPPPIIPIARPKILGDAFTLEEEKDDDDNLMAGFPTASNMGLGSYVDGIDDDQNIGQDDRALGDAFDYFSEKRLKAKANQTVTEVRRSEAPSQSLAMPKMTSAYDNTTAAVSVVVSQPIDAPVPPSIEVPIAPPIDAPMPPPIDMPIPPPIDGPLPPTNSFPADIVPPPIMDMPIPPPIDMPAPPLIEVNAPPKIDVPAPSGDRGILPTYLS